MHNMTNHTIGQYAYVELLRTTSKVFNTIEYWNSTFVMHYRKFVHMDSRLLDWISFFPQKQIEQYLQIKLLPAYHITLSPYAFIRIPRGKYSFANAHIICRAIYIDNARLPPVTHQYTPHPIQHTYPIQYHNHSSPPATQLQVTHTILNSFS